MPSNPAICRGMPCKPPTKLCSYNCAEHIVRQEDIAAANFNQRPRAKLQAPSTISRPPDHIVMYSLSSWIACSRCFNALSRCPSFLGKLINIPRLAAYKDRNAESILGCEALTSNGKTLALPATATKKTGALIIDLRDIVISTLLLKTLSYIGGENTPIKVR